MAENIHASGETAGKDIVFDCPLCGKSLSIDARGAGLMVACPECQREVQVPGLPPSERAEQPATDEAPQEAATQIASLSQSLEASQVKVERLVASLEEVRDRRRYLEQLRTDNMARFELIGKELVMIQNSLDRIVSVLQDASAEKSAPPA